MSIETDWPVENYANDIHTHLRSKERHKRFIYHGQSPQLAYRKCLVEWMSLICERLQFCKNVQHLAIYLLDIFMDNHSIHIDHLKLVTLGCLMCAVKLEERDNLIPTNSHYNALVGNKYKLKEFLEMEVTVLKFFNWDILYPTAAHFVDYYVSHAHDEDDCHDEGPLASYDTLKLYFQKYMDYFLDVSLRDTIFYKVCPSMVAASCILSTRVCLNLHPPWPIVLQHLTYYKNVELKPCVDILLRTINADVLTKKVTHIYTVSGSNASDSSPGSSDGTLVS